MAKQRNELEQSALANLQKVIELQKRNIADTERFQKAMKSTEEAQWNEASGRQGEIRKLMRDLLDESAEAARRSDRRRAEALWRMRWCSRSIR